MKAQLTVYRLYSTDGVCLYVGRTSNRPIVVARNLRSTRHWGPAIDMDHIPSKTYPNETAALKAQHRWMADYAPVFPITPRPLRQKTGRAKPAELSLTERARLAQQRHRLLTK